MKTSLYVGLCAALLLLGQSCSDDGGNAADLAVGDLGRDLPWGGGDVGGGSDVVARDSGAAVDQRVLDGGTPVTGSWVKVTVGKFQMGSPSSEPCRESDETQHEVTLTRDFEIWSLEVTQAQFQGAMGFNPSANTTCGVACPVENTTWSVAVSYCNALSAKQGLTACYSCSGSQAAVTCTVAAGYNGANKTIYDCPGYRLPTDAEWEFAYRAGTTTALYNGALPAASCTAQDPNADAIGWYNKNSGGDTNPVGQKAKNALGLYDMAGNAQEWVHDGYTADLGTGPVTNPVQEPTGTQGIIRGGSFAHGAEDMRAAHRKPQTFKNKGTSLGFRCVRTLNP